MEDTPWSILGIDPTDDERAIKRAYATKVKIHSPEADPAGYMKLRAAYDRAKEYARYQQEVAEQEQAPETSSDESPATPEIDTGSLPAGTAAQAAPAATPQKLAIGELHTLLSQGEREKFLQRLTEIKAAGTFESLDDQYHFIGTVALMVADVEVVDSEWRGRIAEALGAREGENIFTGDPHYWHAYDSLLDEYATLRRYRAQSHAEEHQQDSAAPGYLHVYHVLTAPFDAERLSALTRSLSYHRLAERLLARSKNDPSVAIPPENREWWERTAMAGQHRPMADTIAEPAPAPAQEDNSSRFPFWALGFVLLIMFNATRSCTGSSSYSDRVPADFQKVRTEMPFILTAELAKQSGAEDASKVFAQCSAESRRLILLRLIEGRRTQRPRAEDTPETAPMPAVDLELASLLDACRGADFLDPNALIDPPVSTPADNDLPPEPVTSP